MRHETKQVSHSKNSIMKKVAINGFGRIGRAALKVIFETNDLELVGVNDLMSIENAAYLLKYDSNYGKYEKDIKVEGDTLLIVDVEDEMSDRTAALLNQYGAVDIGARSRTAAEPAKIPAAPASRAFPTPAQAASKVAPQATVPVIQEEIEIGKRTVERGGVRVHSHVEELPVEEVVRLREEHVDVERRAVNRPVATNEAFEEITIEVPETAEQAVVAKQSRVVEEVVIEKTSEEHEETIAETVRRQEVDVEQLPRPGTGGRR